MANNLTHDALRIPVRGAKFNVRIPFDNEEDAAEVFDTEISKDNGAFADCTNELEIVGGGTSCDMGYLTLTAAEMTANSVVLKLNAVSGVQPTLIAFEPANLPALYSGVMTAGSTTQCTLAAGNRPDVDMALAGCILRNNTTGEAREIRTYNGTTGVAVFDAMETACANTHTYDVLLPEEAALDHFASELNKSGIDQILATVSSNLDVAVSTRLATAGYTAPLDAAGTRSALGLATNNLDTQLGDIPTNAEFNARTIVSASYALEATLTAMKGATFNGATDSLEALRDRGDAAWTTGSGGLDAAGIRAAVGLAAANLDTQLGTIVADTNELQVDWVNGGRLDLLVDAIKAKTDNLPSAVDGKTLQQWFQIVGAMAGGNVSGAGTGTEVLTGLDGATTRITATVVPSGNRTLVFS